MAVVGKIDYNQEGCPLRKVISLIQGEKSHENFI